MESWDARSGGYDISIALAGMPQSMQNSLKREREIGWWRIDGFQDKEGPCVLFSLLDGVCME